MLTKLVSACVCVCVCVHVVTAVSQVTLNMKKVQTLACKILIVLKMKMLEQLREHNNKYIRAQTRHNTSLF